MAPSFLEATNVTLTGDVSLLDSFEGQDVTLVGDLTSSPQNPTVAVTSISPGVETFEIDDPARIGTESSLEVRGTPGRTAFGFLSLAQGFFRLRSGEVLLIDPSDIPVQGSGPIPGNGELEITFDIPNDPSLVGLEVFGQGAIFTGSGVQLTNAYMVTVQN